MDIDNHFPHQIILTAANSPVFEYIELHRSIAENETNMFRMVKQEQVKIRSGQNFEFLPGGYHLMLINPRRNLAVNESVPINLIFNNGQEIEVNFKVRKHQLKLEENGWF